MVSQFTSTATPEPFICVSPAMRRVLEDAARAALTDRPVQLLGESGCGKGRIAREIHGRSARRDRPFVLWSAPEGSDSLGQHDLFGHVRGAFTGADRDGIGLLEAAHTGTLVIDDVDKMDLGLQAALLRFLDSWSLRRLGSTSLIRVDIRLILTTNRPLDAVVGEKRFLPDLFWRLRGLRIEVPPLRERVEDLPPLIDHFTTRFAADFAKPAPRYSKAALDILLKARWPGNIRQLAGTVENLVFHAAQDRPIGPEAVLRELDLRGSGPDSGRTPGAGRRGIAKDVLVNALELSHWNSVQTAADLGFPLRTVRRWMKKYGISRGKRKASSNGHGIPG
jgi:DNA-binding NtrC family response regulator